MSYTKRIVCLASSFKHGGLCIAGREVTERGFGPWIRPVSARSTAELSREEYAYEDGEWPKPLDLIEVPLLRAAPRRHQTENMLIDDEQRLVKRGRAGFHRLTGLCEHPESLWLDGESTFGGHLNCVSSAKAKQFNSSLCLIEVPSLQIEVVRDRGGTKALRALFDYGGNTYKLSITDPAAHRRWGLLGLGTHPVPANSKIFLCISLSEPYFDRRCHKLVASVLMDPLV